MMIIAVDASDGLAVGALTLRLAEYDNDPPEIMWLAVDEEYRKRGIATRLTEAAIAKILQSGYSGEVAVCPLGTEQAMTYWNSAGFYENPSPELSSICTVFTRQVG